MKIEIAGDRLPLIRPHGEIDISNVGQLSDTLGRHVDASDEGLILDLSDVQYIDSAGIHAILSAYSNIRKIGGGGLALVLGSQGIRDLLGVLHLDQLPGFLITEDTASAETALLAAMASR